MSTWPIAPLGTNDLNFGVVNYDFTGLTAGELADLPNLEAAIDATLADFGTSLADQAVLIDSIAGDLDDLNILLNEMASDDFEQILADLAGIAAASDGLLSGFTALAG